MDKPTTTTTTTTTTQTSSAKYGTVIKVCTCDNEYQDKRYGTNRRVHNLCNKGEKARCTVCGKEN